MWMCRGACMHVCVLFVCCVCVSMCVYVCILCECACRGVGTHVHMSVCVWGVHMCKDVFV